MLSDPVQRSRYDDSVGVTRGGRRVAPATNGSSPPGDAVEVVEADDVELVDDDTTPATQPADDLDWRGRPRRPRREAPPPPPMAEGLELPTMGRRLAGDAIDVITLIAVGLGIYQLATLVSGGAGFAIFAAGALLLVFLYVALPVYRNGQTLGKRMTYTMVVDRLSGQLLTPRQIMLRYSIPTLLGLTLGSLAPIGVMLGFTYAFGRDQVSLLDRMAKSVVVVARYQPTRGGSADS